MCVLYLVFAPLSINIVGYFVFRIQGLDCGDNVAVWLCHVLGRQCRLVQMNPNFHREIKTQTGRERERERETQ